MSEPVSEPVVLTVARDFAAPAERVFDAWLDPGDARRFLFATPGGAMQRVDIDARVGGGFTIVERRGEVDAGHYGRFVEIDRPRRLVFLFAADPAGPDDGWTRVTIEIAGTATGCRLTLTHEMAPEWADYEARTRDGWTMILASLAPVTES